MTTLEVDFVKLSECLVSSGWRLTLDGTDAPAIHYNLMGTGRITIGDHPPIDLYPHTLIVAPPKQTLFIEVRTERPVASSDTTVDGHWFDFEPGAFRKFIAGNGKPELILICGYFRASFGASVNLFEPLSSPIVEQFDATDQLDHKLKSALAELVAQEVGSGAMTTALLKQVLITLFRRSLSSLNLWVERFSILADPQIARAFADMVAEPGAPHSVNALSRKVGLSRSVFMERFAAALGKPPMAILRQLRMRQAAALLANSNLSIDQISHDVGYASRSSFFRAFRKVFGSDPSEYRGKVHRSRG
jgi:AraC family transcriptional activator of mtrCDE